MWLQGGRGCLQMWPILLLLTTLTGSVAGEDLCYKVSPYYSRIDLAQSKCVKYGGHLMRVRNQEDVWTVKNLTSGLSGTAPDDYVCIDGLYTNSIWEYYDGTEITWIDKWYSLTFNVNKKWIVMHVTTETWFYTNSAHYHRYICEAPKVTNPSTNGSCYQPAPELQNANKTENATHVVYECHPGYEVADGNTSITWECGCTALVSIEPCLPIKPETCLVQTYGHRYVPFELQQYCRRSGGTPPQVFSQRDNDDLQQKMAEQGLSTSNIMLDIRSEGSNFRSGDGKLINYTHFSTVPSYHIDYKFLQIEGTNGIWSNLHYTHSHIIPVCEIIKEQVEGGCSTGRPTFPNSTIVSQNETHVTYICDTNYAFPDGTLQKTVKCGCENGMLIHGCHMANRDICVQPLGILADVTHAEKFCNTAGGMLAKIINDEEMAELPDSGEFYIGAVRRDGIWEWGDGTRKMYPGWWPGHPYASEVNGIKYAVLLLGRLWEKETNDLLYLRYFICEFQPVAICPGTIPAVPHSSATTNGTHITYTCDDRHRFDDGSPNKTVRCNCAGWTKLNGCHRTSRDVCFVHTSLSRTLNAARNHCAAFGTSLAKALNEEERDRLLNLMTPQDVSPLVWGGWLGASYNTTTGIWEYDDDKQPMIWDSWYTKPVNFWKNKHTDLVLGRDGKFYNTRPEYDSLTIYCEMEYDPSVPCSDDPPGIAHGTVSATNTTHVTYRCDENYAFSDGEPERSFPCGCEVLANVSGCLLFDHDVYYINTAYEMIYGLGSKLCQSLGGAMPRVYSVEEQERLKSVVPPVSVIQLAPYLNTSTKTYVYSEEEVVVWNMFRWTDPSNPRYPHLTLWPNSGVWFFSTSTWNRFHVVCEKMRQRQITCETEEPPPVYGATFTHNGTHVNYTCNDKHGFKYGELYMVYPCDVASLASLYPCHRTVMRDLCLVYVKSKATNAAAYSYCKKLNGTLMKITNDEEQQRAADMWDGDTFIQGSDQEEEGVWRLEDGSLMVYSKQINPVEHNANDFLYMYQNKYWYQTVAYMHFICEKETDPSVTCTSPPPTMPYADMTYNTTHVNYTCHPGAAFYDGDLTKIYTCSCASFEVNQACIQNTRDVCFVLTKAKRHQPQQASVCQHYNLSIAKIVNYNEIATAISLMDDDSNGIFIGMTGAENPGMYTNADGTPVTYMKMHGYFRPSSGIRLYRGEMHRDSLLSKYKGLCEIEGAYSCEDAPEVENADRNVTATEVIYTCKPHHSFSDGETQKTYSCLCAQTAVIENCKPESRPVCIAKALTHSAFHRTARSICQSRKAELPRLITDADARQFEELGISPMYLDGDTLNDDHLYKYSNGEIIRWTQHSYSGIFLEDRFGRSALFLNGNWQYQRIGADVLHPKVYCEVPKDESCTQTPPDVPHATFVSNSTHVTYRCEKGHKFLDDLTEKVYPCECVKAATIDPCIGPRPMCFVQSEFRLNQDRAESFCNKSGAHLAKIESAEEVDLMLLEMKTDCFISANDKTNDLEYNWYDNTPVTYDYWIQRGGGDILKHAIYLNRNRHMYPSYNEESRYFLCEKELSKASCAVPEQQRSAQNFATEAECEENNYCWQVPTSGSVPSCFDPIVPAEMPTNEELCGTPPSIAHGTCVLMGPVELPVVTCTCDSDSQYYDGSTTKTYSCDCASLAVIKPCALKTRSELCLVESAVKRSHTEASKYCKKKSGRLAILYTQAEQDRLLAMSVRDTLWLGATDDKDEQLWTVLVDAEDEPGDLLIWSNFDVYVPTNTSRNSLLVDRTTIKWMDAPADEIHGFVCEAPIDVGCSSAAPYLDNADRTLAASTVTYRCLDGYTFPDGTIEKTYNCQCYGLLGLLQCKGRTIYSSSYPTTHEDAEETCVYLGGNLVEVNDGSTSASTINTLNDWKESSAWISSMSTHESGFEGVDCVTIGMDGQWTVTNCTHHHHFVCQFGDDMDKLPWEVKSKLASWKMNDLLRGVPDLVPAPGKRSIVYFTPGSSQTWIGAQDTCSGLGGNLARATSNDEAWVMAAVINRNNMRVAWVDGKGSGTSQSSTGKTIVAPSVVTLTVTSGSADPPQCLQAGGFTWTDNDCETQQQFICEKKIGADWPDTNYCTWKEELTQTWTDAQATCQQHNAELARVDNAWDWENIVDASGEAVGLLWLGAKEEANGVWTSSSWSHWAEGGQDTGQLGCMVYDGQSCRMREHSCTATDVTGFFCRRSNVTPPNNMKVLRNLQSVLSLGCNPGYGFVDGLTKKSIPSTIDCKTFNAWVAPSDPYSTCYPTNNFMMKRFGNYNTEDELALADENHETCTDLLKIWTKGPKIANFRKVWKCSTPFEVTLNLNPEFSNMITGNSKKKMAIRVEVSKDSPWDDNGYGNNKKFTKCTQVSAVKYSCLCIDDVNPFSVFVSITIRDASVLTGVGSLQLCDISLAPNI